MDDMAAGSSVMANGTDASTSSGPRAGSRTRVPAASGSDQTDAARSGWKNSVHQPSAISAVMATLRGPTAARITGIRGRTGWLMSFNGFPSPDPVPGGNGTW